MDDEDLGELGSPWSCQRVSIPIEDFVNVREKFSGCERLWSDLVQEEIRRSTRDGSSSKAFDEEDCALWLPKQGRGRARRMLLNPVRMVKSVACPK